MCDLTDPEEKLGLMLQVLSNFIKDKLEKKKLSDDYTFPQNQLYQMYFVMARLDAIKFCKLDFIVNFGVAPEVKSKMTQLMETATNTALITQYLETLEPLVYLKLHKYFFWADKKLHSVFYIEDKDHINEDLLIDFKDEGDPQNKYVHASNLASKKNKVKPQDEPQAIELDRAKNTITKEDLLFGQRHKKKFVNIQDEDDFPDLEGELDDDFPKPKKQTGAKTGKTGIV
jgi:hypothetical protein